MTLPSAYLTSTKNLRALLEAMKKAQAPNRFTQKFLEGLGFTSSTDRLAIAVLKAIGFISITGEPLARYHQFLDTTQSAKVLGESLREAYADLFQINRNAQSMSRADVKNKMKTLSQGQFSDAVLDKMAMTFKALAEVADFSGPALEVPSNAQTEEALGPPDEQQEGVRPLRRQLEVNGLVYNINIHLPESRDPAVYDALFRSLREHL